MNFYMMAVTSLFYLPLTVSSTMRIELLVVCLYRGVLVGIVAGLLVFITARWFGKPQVDRAIAFEGFSKSQGEIAERELVSRNTQRTADLITGILTYGAALDGMFGLFLRTHMAGLVPEGSRELSAVLSGLGLNAITLVLSLKYPANPPAVGSPETIGMRTATFFLMICVQ